MSQAVLPWGEPSSVTLAPPMRKCCAYLRDHSGALMIPGSTAMSGYATTSMSRPPALATALMVATDPAEARPSWAVV